MDELRTRLERVFHALPPPEALGREIPCPEFVAPKDGSPSVPVIDRHLLQYLATGQPGVAIKDGAVTPAPLIDGFTALNTDVFNAIRLQDIAAAREAAGLRPGERPSADVISSGLADLVRAERLLVVLADLDPDPTLYADAPTPFTGGAYRGHVVFYNLSTARPFCFAPFTAETAQRDAPPELAPKLLEELSKKTRTNVDAAIASMHPTLSARWPRM